MDLEIRLTTIEDYQELVDWWKWHKWSVPPSIELLDSLKYGIMISLNNQNLCAGFIYFTNASAFALIEFIVSTYKIRDRDIRSQAKKLLIVSLMDVAKKQGVRTLFSSVRHEALIKDYIDCGFTITSKNSNELVAHIK